MSLTDPAQREIAAQAIDLHKTYGKGAAEVRALDGVSLDLYAGQFTAIMGPSGSGKSTLMHCLAALDKPTTGEVRRRRSQARQDARPPLTSLRRDKIGFVFQAFNLVPTLTAQENILLPLSLARTKPDRAGSTRSSTRSTCGRGSPTGRASSPADSSSASPCARALVSRPDIVFADEPTGNLDSTLGRRGARLPAPRVDDLGQTIVMVTHDPVAASYCDRVIFLADGRVVDELAKPSREEILAHMADLQASGDGPGSDRRRSLRVNERQRVNQTIGTPPSRLRNGDDRSEVERRAAAKRGGGGVLRLTLRNLAAHKVRLLMSTLAIVLGVAFLAGVLTFSHGLDRTFSGIINGSTPDGQVRPTNSASSAEASRPGSGGAATLGPAAIEKLRTLPEVARADGVVQGAGLYVLDTDDKLVSSSGAPTLAFNHTGTPNLLGEPSLELIRGSWPTGDKELVLDEATAEKAGYQVGDSVTLIAPQGETRRKVTLTGTASFNGGGTAGAQLLIFSTAGAQSLFTDGKDVYSGISLTAAPGVSQKELVEAAETVVPKGFEAVTGDKMVEESEDAIGEFLDVISVFLIVFAVIAVIVGAFIIVNTFSILIAQRSRQLALLRALGLPAARSPPRCSSRRW